MIETTIVHGVWFGVALGMMIALLLHSYIMKQKDYSRLTDEQMFKLVERHRGEN